MMNIRPAIYFSFIAGVLISLTAFLIMQGNLFAIITFIAFYFSCIMVHLNAPRH